MIARIFKGASRRLLRSTGKLKSYVLSTNTWTGHRPQMGQPLILAGLGKIRFEADVKIGVWSSPNFWSSECYLEARSASAKIEIRQNTRINNNFSAISENGSISIGQDCVIGHDVFVIDSNFHTIDPDLRRKGNKSMSMSVFIGDNVFIGSRAIILRNSCIGEGSVVAAGAVVSGTFPPRSLIAGNPAKLVKAL